MIPPQWDLGENNDSSTFLFQLLLLFLEKRVSLCKAACSCQRNNYLRTARLGLLSPRNVWSIFGLPRKFQLPFVKYLAGIFFSLSYCSFSITFDILSFTDGNRSRMDELKIACQGGWSWEQAGEQQPLCPLLGPGFGETRRGGGDSSGPA